MATHDTVPVWSEKTIASESSVLQTPCQRPQRQAWASRRRRPMGNPQAEERRRGRRARSRARRIDRGRQRAGAPSRPRQMRNGEGAPPRLCPRASRPGNSLCGARAPMTPAPRRRRGGLRPPATRARCRVAPLPGHSISPGENSVCGTPPQTNSVTLGDRGVRKPLLHGPVAFSSGEPVACATGSPTLRSRSAVP